MNDIPNRPQRCWVVRIDKFAIEILSQRILAGRLHQGWGWDEKQRLDQSNAKLAMDEGASRNRRMFRDVKKDDLILVANCPSHGKITLVSATEDWNIGYRFDIIKEITYNFEGGDYGHSFPVKLIRIFDKNNPIVSSSIRDTLRCAGRFWNIDALLPEVIAVQINPENSSCDALDRWEQNIISLAENEEFSKKIWKKTIATVSKAEWENLLAKALQRINPSWSIRRCGGQKESEHGTDIIASFKGLFQEIDYGIAIQVKDYHGKVNESPIDQLLKARRSDYWRINENIKIVDLYLVLTKSEEIHNSSLLERAEKEGVTILWKEELMDIIVQFTYLTLTDQ